MVVRARASNKARARKFDSRLGRSVTPGASPPALLLAPAAAEGTQSTYTTHTDGDSSGAAHLEYQPVAGGPFDAEIRADDPLGAKYTVRIEVAHGTITLTRASDEDGSLTFGLDPSHLAALLLEDSDGVNDADLTFSGSLSDVNRALESCVYKSDLNW